VEPGSDIEELISFFRDFDKLGFKDHEIQDILNKRKEAIAKNQLQALSLKFRRRIIQEKNALDDKNSLLNMFKELQREKERKERERALFLEQQAEQLAYKQSKKTIRVGRKGVQT
jgi:N-acyl-D-aspartate/D-glutamate deacylase